MLAVRTVTPPAEEPVSIFEAAEHLRLDTEDEDALVAALVSAAREAVERQSGLCLVERELELRMGDRIPDPLPRGPLVSVSSINYRDATGVVRTIDPDDYVVFPGLPGSVEPAAGRSWPCGSHFTLTGVFGHEDVPAIAKQAILLLVGHWFEHREAVTPSNLREVPVAAQALIDLLRWRLVH